MRLTGMGFKVYSDDVLMGSLDKAFESRKEPKDPPTFDATRFFAENLQFDEASIDAVLAWDVFDYLPEAAVKPLVDRLHRVMRPGGAVLAFFHAREAGPEAPHHRYHITGADSLEMEPMGTFRLQRIFNNRHIENLFADFRSVKFFLARDNLREVLIVR